MITYEPIQMKDCSMGCGGWMMLPASRTYTCPKCDAVAKAEEAIRKMNEEVHANGFVAGPGAIGNNTVNARRYRFTQGAWDVLRVPVSGS